MADNAEIKRIQSPHQWMKEHGHIPAKPLAPMPEKPKLPWGTHKAKNLLTGELHRQLSEKLHGEVTRLEDFVNQTLKLASNGHPVAMKIVWDRIDGPMTEKLEIEARVAVIKVDI